MKNHEGLSALVAEGGGMRGIFTAGVLKSFGERGYDPFDLYIGVSAGACNLASYLAGQFDRNHFINTTWSPDRRFMSMKRFLRGGHYMDLDWLWDITIREYRLDLDVIFDRLGKKDGSFLVAVTSVMTGKALYLKPDKDTLEHYLKVSSSLPLLYRTLLDTDQGPATDGGIADSIPVMEAYRRGARDITVIRTRPAQYEKKERLSPLMLSLAFRRYPELAKAIRRRADTYREALSFIKNPREDVRIKEIYPPPDLSVGRTCRDIEQLNILYNQGIMAGERYVSVCMDKR